MQRLEAVPGLGILLVVSAKRHRLAARDSSITVVCGSIGIWLPLILRFGANAQGTILGRLSEMVGHGDIYILVPSLVAPLFLLLAVLKDSKAMRRHQVGLFSLSALATLASLYLYARSSNSSNLDSIKLIGSVAALTAVFVLLYLNCLISELPDRLLYRFKNTSKDVTDGVVELRKREGK